MGPCKECVSFWTNGIKDGKRNKWCGKFGGPARAVLGHCKLMHGHQPKEPPNGR